MPTFPVNADGYADLSPEESLKLLQSEKGVLALDVRTPQEFVGELGHLRGSVLIPVEQLQARIGEIQEYKNKKTVVICRAGHRSRTAASILVREGFQNVVNLMEGMIGVNKIPGAPIER
ncbi:MAG: rhodanese-like domain-containing protein [Nitrospinae bacterium]|nr:rhodanese-like domain-containing protein [Nitrospinota bacterium]